MAKRARNIWSVKNELIQKSQESMLSAVQVYNNPNIKFKSEIFIVLSVIAWTYLMHAYYRGKAIEYRYFKMSNRRRKFDKTKHGMIKHWELEKCLDSIDCPLDNPTKENLRFLIGLRHEIEHQMTTRIDDLLSAKLQACCLNFNNSITAFFGQEFGISKHLSFSLQFSSISDLQADQLTEAKELPAMIQSYISDFDNGLDEAIYNDPKYSYRVLFIPKLANRKGQADRVIEFIPANSPIAEGINKEYVITKEREKPKYLPKALIEKIQERGFSKLNQYHFVKCWKQIDGKKENGKYGTCVGNKEWYWYDNFIPILEKYCEDNNLR
jgi:hypothetical protein